MALTPSPRSREEGPHARHRIPRLRLTRRRQGFPASHQRQSRQAFRVRQTNPLHRVPDDARPSESNRMPAGNEPASVSGQQSPKATPRETTRYGSRMASGRDRLMGLRSMEIQQQDGGDGKNVYRRRAEDTTGNRNRRGLEEEPGNITFLLGRRRTRKRNWFVVQWHRYGLGRHCTRCENRRHRLAMARTGR